MKTCIVTPVKDSAPEPHVSSVFSLGVHLAERGEQVIRKSVWLSSSLPEARTLLAKAALESEADRVLFVDDDICFSNEDFDRAAEAALGGDIVAGIYKKRIAGGDPAGYPLEGDDANHAPPLLAMAWVGLGFTVVPRVALQRMLETYGDACFEFVVRDGRLIGEDQCFCEKWRAIGGRIWLHTQVQLGHVGPHIFR